MIGYGTGGIIFEVDADKTEACGIIQNQRIVHGGWVKRCLVGDLILIGVIPAGIRICQSFVTLGIVHRSKSGSDIAAQ